ncbi:MAG: MFS transporter [Dehalococcoidales bacterium]|nr:MFS transporter [Dehalococcoidales bacterium]
MNIFKPKPSLTEEETAHGLRIMALEGMTSLGFTSITTSGILAAFALALGANNFQIGILAAIPFIMQLIQLPTILLVEKLRWRKAIAVFTWFLAQLLWFPMALIPVFIETPGAKAISALLVLMAIRSVFLAITNCSWNSWIRDLVPQNILGRFFSRRLAYSTIAAAVFGVGAAFFVDYWNGQVSQSNSILGYTYALVFGALFLGMVSPILMTLMPEPLMRKPPEVRISLWEIITLPFRDRNFRQLMKFLFSLNFALNMAVPFFAVYMLQRIGLPLPVVIGFSVLSQLFNILFLRVWGAFADRFSNKSVLSICASLYLVVILTWAFIAMPDRYFLTIPLLIAVHIFAGIAAAGVTLTIGTIGYKLAPQAQSVSYLTGASLATNLGAGLGPIFGGFLAYLFAGRTLALDLTWIDPNLTLSLGVLNITGLDFLFVITFIIGLITLNILAGLREEGEAGREVILDELRKQARSAIQSVSPLPDASFINMFPRSFLYRVPGLDVAIGVTEYQLADTAKAITIAALRSGRTAVKIARSLQNELIQLWKTGVTPPEYNAEVARYTARGAVHAVNETTADIKQVAGPAMVGIVKALDKANVNPYDAIRLAAFGIVEGANDIGKNLQQAAKEAIAGAKNIAHTLNLNEDVAAQQAAQGVLEAAKKLGTQEAASIRDVLPRETVSESSPTQQGEDKTTSN